MQDLQQRFENTAELHIREHLLRDGLISPDDLNLYRITDNADEAVKIVLAADASGASTAAVQKRQLENVAKLITTAGTPMVANIASCPTALAASRLMAAVPSYA